MAEALPQNVRVAVRVRPQTPKENLEHQSSCLRVYDDERQIVVGKDRAFTFDFVFNEQSTQQQVFQDACAPLVAGCMNGYNATVFAYGQTGSGKTYTMGSGDTGDAPTGDLEKRGVIPRVVDELFDALAAKSDTTDSIVRVSYLEIYNEEVKDLLRPRTPSKEIAIREDAAGGIFVLGVHERVVHTREELFASLAAGSNCRATGATLMNAVSSRSHSLFTVIVEQRPRTPGEDRTCAKLHLVDLAGSERAKKTGAEGKRFKESVTINQGLLALGNVIAALCEDSRPGKRKESVQHVPYRESKLTRLLQDSLGGNTQTLMVACVGPAADNMDESLNTLRYADRARKIANKPVQNKEAPSIVDLRGEIAALQQQLQQQQSTGKSIRELNEEREQLQTDQRTLSSQVQSAAAQSDALSLDFEAQQEQLSASVRDLTLNIRLKEELIRELTRADEESRTVVSSYQTRLREMSDKINSLQEQLMHTKSEMEVAERQAGRSEEQKARLRSEYEKRLRETEGQLHEMRRRQKEQERALRSREAAERKLVELRGEVDKMRSQQGGLKETMKLSAQRYEQSRHERERELAGLRKQGDESARKEELEAREAADQLAVIDAEEEALMVRKGAAEALKMELERREGVLAEREAVLASRETLQLKQLRTSLSLRHSIDGLSTQLHGLDERIEALRAEGEHDGSELAQLLGERREAQERLMGLEALGEAGGSELLDQAAGNELRELEERLEDLTAQLEFKNSAIGDLRESLGRMGGLRGLAPAGAPGAASVGDDSSLSQQIGNMSLPIARRVLHAEVQRVLQLRQAQSEHTRRLEAAQVAAQERDAEVASLRAALRTSAAEHERQMREAAEAHAAQHAALEPPQYTQPHHAEAQPRSPPPSGGRMGGACVASVATPPSNAATPEGGRESFTSLAELLAEGGTPSREAIEALGKDNFYYRQSNKELRRKLKEERQALETKQLALDEASALVTRDAREKERMHRELANMRAYLAAHPGATPTRVTKAALKEISPAVLDVNGAPPRAAWPDRPLEPDGA